MPIEYTHDHENEITLFAETNFRNAKRRFGIKTDDRRRHVYILGKTGMGKTTLQENMFLSDVLAGHGCCYVDPHGDTAEKLLDYIPSHRINDVVYFNPSDMDFPLGFNILETVDDDKKHLIASGLMGVFKKIWPDVWSPRMEYILLNCVLALLDYPGATLLGINRLLVDKEYRKRVISKIRDPIVKTFWVAEFSSWSEKYATEAIAPVQNKVGQFLSASIIRNIVAQVKSTIDLRDIMDNGKILVVNLSKGKIGEDNMRLLGGMLITKLQMAAMERVDIAVETDRRDFYLYVDEFQNFANESFANILSEARKYRLNLIVAHQYIKQLDEKVCWAVFGNVGTIITFRVGADDAAFMENEFMPAFTPEDLVNITKFQIYLKLMVDGAATPPFSATTLPPIAKRTGSTPKVISVSRERYASPRPVIEEKVLKWSGMEASEPSGDVSYPDILTEEERTAVEEAGEASGKEYLKMSDERLAAIAKPQAAKKDKPAFKHTCSRCGKTWDMPIQLDSTRPMFCAECLPLVREERKTKTGGYKAVLHGSNPSGSVQDVPPATKHEAKLHKAFEPLDAVKHPAPSSHQKASNTPRVYGTPTLPPAAPKGTIKIVRDSGSSKEESLLSELMKTKNGPVETRKDVLSGSAPSMPSTTSRDQERNRRKRKRGGQQQTSNIQQQTSSIQHQASHNRQPTSNNKADMPFEPIRLEEDSRPLSPTVFRSTDSSVNSAPPTSSHSSSNFQSLKPGQRITF